MDPSQFMSNPLQRMRMANLIRIGGPTQGRFGAQAPPPPPAPTPQPRSDDDRYLEDMTNLQSNVGPGIQAYRKYLSEMPNREDFRPGVMTRIAAALSGLSAGYRDPGAGVQVASDINSSNYRNAMGDYANRGVGLKEQAGLEQDELDSKLRMLQNARAMGLKYDEFDLKRRQAESQMNNDTTTANATMTRAQAYAKAQGRPRHQYRDQQDGSVLEINEDTGQQRVIPAQTIAAGQLGVSRRNAATNERNAATSVRRTNIYDRSVTEAGRHNGAMERRPTGGTPSPNAQQDAEDMALDELAQDPMFRDFVKTEGGNLLGRGGYNVVGEDDGSEEYGAFIDALNAKTQEILQGQRRRIRPGGRQ